MKALITKVTFKDEKETKFGMQYTFLVEYDGKKAYYNSKKKDQTKFVEGQEAEFTETEHTSGKGNTYYIVKPEYKGGNSNFGRQLQREQSKYSGFAVSYAKDLVIADKIGFEQLLPAAQKMFDFMVALDKSIEK